MSLFLQYQVTIFAAPCFSCSGKTPLSSLAAIFLGVTIFIQVLYNDLNGFVDSAVFLKNILNNRLFPLFAHVRVLSIAQVRALARVSCCKLDNSRFTALSWV
jgi:hypothetical protein